MTNEELAKYALELAENATPGPWEFDLAKCGVKDADGQPVGSICWDEDATFIAEARTLVPLLAKRLLEADTIFQLTCCYLPQARRAELFENLRRHYDD